MGSNGVLAWRTITQDYTQFGQNHGSTGILMQFFRLPEVFNNVTVSNYIRATLDYFLTIQYPSGNFPTPMKPPFPTVPDILVQWDHGGPAFVPILGEAYLRGVVPHEIGHDAPESATQAQTIIGGTF